MIFEINTRTKSLTVIEYSPGEVLDPLKIAGLLRELASALDQLYPISALVDLSEEDIRIIKAGAIEEKE